MPPRMEAREQATERARTEVAVTLMLLIGVTAAFAACGTARV